MNVVYIRTNPLIEALSATPTLQPPAFISTLSLNPLVSSTIETQFTLCVQERAMSTDKVDLAGEKASLDVESNTTGSDNGIDPVAEKKLLWKLDWVLLPMATLICQSSAARELN